MNNKTYTFYSDPSHGWLEVSKKEIEELGIINNVSQYSYINQDMIYLEEDSDASIFINSYKSKYGINPNIYESNQDNNNIRNYSRFKKGK